MSAIQNKYVLQEVWAALQITLQPTYIIQHICWCSRQVTVLSESSSMNWVFSAKNVVRLYVDSSIPQPSGNSRKRKKKKKVREVCASPEGVICMPKDGSSQMEVQSYNTFFPFSQNMRLHTVPYCQLIEENMKCIYLMNE